MKSGLSQDSSTVRRSEVVHSYASKKCRRSPLSTVFLTLSCCDTVLVPSGRRECTTAHYSRKLIREPVRPCSSLKLCTNYAPTIGLEMSLSAQSVFYREQEMPAFARSSAHRDRLRR